MLRGIARVFFVSVLMLSASYAFSIEVYNTAGKSISSIEELVSSLAPGSILVLGEYHDHPGHHESHRLILQEMIAQGISFHVGMEFFYYPDQPFVEQYLYREIEEEDFLDKINWPSGDNFEWYRPKVLAPLESGGLTFAINAPRALTRAVAREGLENLPPELQELMPPNFELGSDNYKQKFREAVGGDHFPPEMLDKYFAAQSLWDDTMAWRTLESLNMHPTQDVFVIIVGDFHVSFGGGLPDRLIARGATNVVSVSHLDGTEMSEGEKSAALEPHPDWGQRSDWVVFADRLDEQQSQKPRPMDNLGLRVELTSPRQSHAAKP